MNVTPCADGAVAIFCAKGGVSPVWLSGDRRAAVPRIAYINKMDSLGADFYRSLKMIETKLGAKPVALYLPIGVEDTFNGVVDVLRGKALYWVDELGLEIEEAEIPEDMLELYEEYRENLLTVAADFDDNILEAYLHGAEACRAWPGTQKGNLGEQGVPCFCGTSLRNKGVQTLLDGIIDYLPSPLDVPPIEGGFLGRPNRRRKQ